MEKKEIYSHVLWSCDDDMKYVTFAVVPTELN